MHCYELYRALLVVNADDCIELFSSVVNIICSTNKKYAPGDQFGTLCTLAM